MIPLGHLHGNPVSCPRYYAICIIYYKTVMVSVTFLCTASGLRTFSNMGPQQEILGLVVH